MSIRVIRGLGALVALLLATGCRHGPAFYPLGIFTGGNTNSLVVIRSAGFNAVTGPAAKPFLDAAHHLDLRVLASPGTSAGANFDASAARRCVRAFDAHPALWAWYLVDEPDLALVPPCEVIAANRFLKSLPAHKPTALVIYQGYQALHYANIADFTLVDHYPIPWQPLAAFGQHLRLPRLALGQRKPLVAVIQAFDWATQPELMARERNLRPPNHAELRCMAYCALAERANGLFFFTFDDGRWRMQDHPETWSAVQQIVREVNDSLPLFQAKQLWWAKRDQWPDYARRFNAALEASITTARLRVRHGNWRVPQGDYILAVNNTDWQQTYSFVPPGPPLDAVPVLGEARSLPLRQGWLSDEFAPYAVHVYGPLGIPWGRPPACR